MLREINTLYSDTITKILNKSGADTDKAVRQILKALQKKISKINENDIYAMLYGSDSFISDEASKYAFASDIKNKFHESLEDYKDAFQIAEENGFIQETIKDITDPIFNYFYRDDKNKWYYQRPDSSGRDFFTGIPIYAMSEGDWDRVLDFVDDVIGDYSWGDLDEDYVNEFVYDEFPDILTEYLGGDI